MEIRPPTVPFKPNKHAGIPASPCFHCGITHTDQVRQYCKCSLYKSSRGLAIHILIEIAKDILLWAHSHLLSLRATHLPGKLNVGADMLSQGGVQSRESAAYTDK